jgi:hypothetical protein
MTILLKHDPAFLSPLDLLAPELPKIWDGGHVGLRLSEGFATLRLLPMNGAPHGLPSAWPAYRYEFDDLLAQAETAELERTQRLQNRAKVLPSANEVTHAITATYWPIQYLSARPEICEAVNAVGLAYSLDKDAGWVTRKRGGFADTWRSRHDKGCEIIAAGLMADKTPVF